MSEILHVALLQMSSSDDLEENIDFVKSHAKELTAGSVLMLPEMWSFLVPDSRGDERAAFAQAHGDVIQQISAQIARQHGIYLVAGTSFEWNPQEAKVFNRSRVFGPQGQVLATYDKMHLFDNGISENAYMESRSVVAGKTPETVTIESWLCALSVCYDLRFPNLYEHYSNLGAQALFVPSAFAHKTGKDHWELLLRARAIENQCFVWAANQCGRSPAGVKCWGHSAMIDPWGEILAMAGDEPCLVQADCSMRRLEQVRRLMPVLRHRRSLGL